MFINQQTDFTNTNVLANRLISKLLHRPEDASFRSETSPVENNKNIVFWFRDEKSHRQTRRSDLNATIYPNPVADQLLIWGETHPQPAIAVSSSGIPVDDLANTESAGKNGPLLIQDSTFFDQIQSFNRERVPPRVVHAKGAGAFGYLEITNDISQYSMAKLFSPVGKKTPVAARFSRAGGELASPDTIRDIRGFALKFYTEDGILDLITNSVPVFFIRDTLRFPELIHSIGRNPMTYLPDPNSIWDYATLNPETVYLMLIMFTDYGIPSSYRNINGHSINTFVFVNAEGNVFYSRFHFWTNQGIEVMPVDQASILAGTDPDHYLRDLYNNIALGNIPSWNMTAQIVTPEQIATFPFNPFDATKEWPLLTYPITPIGRLVLNQNPNNYFTDVESIAFNPANLVPGIQPSQDKLLQGRLFAYNDAQTYRIGINGHLLRVNSPGTKGRNYQRDGFARYGDNQGGAVNYYPNSFHGPRTTPVNKLSPFPVQGKVFRSNSSDEDNFSQPRLMYESLTPGQRQRLVPNLVASLSGAYPKLQVRAIRLFNNVSPELAQSLQNALIQAGLPTSYIF